ncbi:MAG: hypothetical protein V3T58_01965 [Candidatus Hydrothermarchaeales archaeon]
MKISISLTLFILYAFVQAKYLHTEFKYWYSPFLYIIIPILPWSNKIFYYTPGFLKEFFKEEGLTRRSTILGTFWGFISFWLIPRTISGGTTLEFWIQKFPDIVQIPLSLPSYVLFKVGLMDFFQGGCTDACFHMIILIPVFILISAMLGASIGYGISKIYLKVK